MLKSGSSWLLLLVRKIFPEAVFGAHLQGSGENLLLLSELQWQL